MTCLSIPSSRNTTVTFITHCTMFPPRQSEQCSTSRSHLPVVESLLGVLLYIRKHMHFVIFPLHICIGKPGKPVYTSHQYSCPFRSSRHTMWSCFTHVLLLNGSDFCRFHVYSVVLMPFYFLFTLSACKMVFYRLHLALLGVCKPQS